MSKVLVKEILSSAHEDSAGSARGPGLVPIVTVMANAGDVNGALLELAQKLQEFLGAGENSNSRKTGFTTGGSGVPPSAGPDTSGADDLEL